MKNQNNFLPMLEQIRTLAESQKIDIPEALTTVVSGTPQQRVDAVFGGVAEFLETVNAKLSPKPKKKAKEDE
jgi:hypothetical protein